MIDKPLRGVLSSNDACGLSHSHPKWCGGPIRPGSLESLIIRERGREEIHIETTAIRDYVS